MLREKDKEKEKEKEKHASVSAAAMTLAEEKKNRQATDPRTAKKQEAEEASRLQERLALSKKSTSQFKQLLISDIGKAINASFPTLNF